MNRVCLWLAFAFLATPSFADDIRAGNPSYGGTGCPAGSVSAALSPDGKSLSFLFDSFVAEAGGTTTRQVDRKTCNIAIPIHVPEGMSVSIFQIEYQGYNNLPLGASSQFSADYFFAGSRGPTYTKTFSGQLAAEFLLKNTIGLTSIMWSPCGQEVNLRINSSMQVRTNEQKEAAFASIDKADLGKGLSYFLQWRRC
jgi:hypothetical protein